MRLDEEIIMDFFREYISISVSSASQTSITVLCVVLAMSFNLIDDGSSALFLIMICFYMRLCQPLCDYLMNFFWTSQKVENRLRVMSDLRDLASAESPDSFTLVYTNILEHQPDCPVRALLSHVILHFCSG